MTYRGKPLWALAVWSALSATLGAAACGDEFVASSSSSRAEAGAPNAGTAEEPSAAGAPSEGGVGAQGNGGGGPSAAGAPSGVADAGAGAGASPSAPTYEDVVLAEEPLAYWRMGAAEHSVVADASGHGNDLVLQGSGHALDLDGALSDDDDGAIGFDGSFSFAIASDARALDFAGNSAFSLECWARRQSGGASYFQHLLSNVDGVAGNRNGYSLYLLPEPDANENARSVFEYDVPATDLGLWGDVVAESVWGHYVAVFEGAQAKLYVNGTLADTEAVTGVLAPRSGPFAVARSSSASGSFFKGALDEIAVYPHALSAKTIAEHFAFAK